jgi:hypothetical protein
MNWPSSIQDPHWKFASGSSNIIFKDIFAPGGHKYVLQYIPNRK